MPETGPVSESDINTFRKPLKVAINTQSSVKGQSSFIYRQPYEQSSSDNDFNMRPLSTSIATYQAVPEEDMITFSTDDLNSFPKQASAV